MPNISAKTLLLSAIMVMLPMPGMAESARLTNTIDLVAVPGRNQERVATLSVGTQVEVERCQGNWCNVSASKVSGWVPSACLVSTGEGKAAGNDLPLRRPPLVLGPGPVRSNSFNPPDWPGQCPAW